MKNESMYLPLVPGNERVEIIELILSVTNLDENTRTALTEYYCEGINLEMCALKYGIIPGNFRRSIKTLNNVNEKFEKYAKLVKSIK